MRTYLIALKRDARGKAPADWERLVSTLPGVKLIGSAKAPVMRVEASPDAIEQIRQHVGPYCNIEPVIAHKKSE